MVLRRLFSKRSDVDLSSVPGPRPDEPLAVIGDIHGRADLLDRLLDKLDKTSPQARRIFVGDYVDRGPDSKAVIDRLRGLPDAICLTGNHEQMMLEFLDRPTERGPRWLHNGGTATLASYGLSLAKGAPDAEMIDTSRKLAKLLSDGTADWLRARSLWWQSGNLLVTHAGPDPKQPHAGQPDDVFVWGHNRFLREPRPDGVWVAHGHWIQDHPVCAEGRVSVDTGAWMTGRLTAALILPAGTVSFIGT